MNNRKKEIIGILLCMLALFIFLSFLTYSPFESPSGLSPKFQKKILWGFLVFILHII